MLEEECVRQLRKCNVLQQAKQIHASIPQRLRIRLSDLVIQMYGRCGSLKDAEHVFLNETSKGGSSLCAMIKAYASQSRISDAKILFESLPHLQNAITGTTLLNAFASSGECSEAVAIFEKLRGRDAAAWNAMLACFAGNSRLHLADSCFTKMPGRNVISSTTMVSAFAHSGHLHEAKLLFLEMPERNIVSWSGLLHGFSEFGFVPQAVETFERMPKWDMTSATTMISAYSSASSQGYVRAAEACFRSMPQRDTPSWSAMLAVYTANGDLLPAKSFFERMPKRDIVSWNIMFTGYAHNGKMDAAAAFFRRMPCRNLSSWGALFSAYIHLGELEKAKDLAAEMEAQGSVSDMKFRNAMLVAYARNGYMEQAQDYFQSFPRKDLLSWTTMLVGYATAASYSFKAFDAFRLMQQEGVEPNLVSYACILAACSDMGKLRDGCRYFRSMLEDYGIRASKEHYCCMVVMLARAGHLEEAEELIETMPFLPDSHFWNALLAASKDQDDGKRAQRAGVQALCFSGGAKSSVFALLTNTLRASVQPDGERYS